MTALPFLAALLAAPALAGPLEIAAEASSLPTFEQGFQRFGAASATPAFGVRLGWEPERHVTVTFAAHHAQRGAAIDTTSNGNGQARSAWVGDDVALGARGNLPIGSAFRFTGEAAATLLRGSARVDDNGRDAGSPVQYRAVGVAPGFRLAGGAAVVIDQSALPVPLTFFAAGGYDWSAPLKQGVLGDLRVRGFAVRAGLGVRL